MPKHKKNKSDASGLAIPAGLFIGMGIGFLTGELVSWMFIGLGGGFALMFIYQLLRSKS